MNKGSIYRVRIIASDYENLLRHLLGHPEGHEEGALLLAGRIRSPHGVIFLVRKVFPILKDAIITSSPVHLDVEPKFIAKVLKKARREKLSVIQAHSHPFSKTGVSFSSRDDFGEGKLFPKILQRIPGVEHAALVFGQGDNFKGRVWLPDGKTIFSISSLRVVGPVIKEISSTSKPKLPRINKLIFDRQIRALGPNGHFAIKNLTVGIVGVGGNGSQIVQALARMGVGQIIAIDPDKVENHNRSRLIGARKEDADNHIFKIEIMKRLVDEVDNNNTKFIGISEPVEHAKSLDVLKESDVIFCCTDNLNSRDLLNGFAHLYLIPVIDMGLEFQPDKNGNLYRASGYFVTIIPGYLCLHSLKIVTEKDILKEKGQAQHPGYLGKKERPAGQVIAFNGLVAYHAIAEFLNMTTGFRKSNQPTYLIIDFLKEKDNENRVTIIQPCDRCKNLFGFGEIKEMNLI